MSSAYEKITPYLRGLFGIDADGGGLSGVKHAVKLALGNGIEGQYNELSKTLTVSTQSANVGWKPILSTDFSQLESMSFLGQTTATIDGTAWSVENGSAAAASTKYVSLVNGVGLCFNYSSNTSLVNCNGNYRTDRNGLVLQTSLLAAASSRLTAYEYQRLTLDTPIRVRGIIGGVGDFQCTSDNSGFSVDLAIEAGFSSGWSSRIGDLISKVRGYSEDEYLEDSIFGGVRRGTTNIAVLGGESGGFDTQALGVVNSQVFGFEKPSGLGDAVYACLLGSHTNGVISSNFKTSTIRATNYYPATIGLGPQNLDMHAIAIGATAAFTPAPGSARSVLRSILVEAFI